MTACALSSSAAQAGSPTNCGRVLQAAPGADELLVTSVTYDHTDRIRSHELLAAEWLG